MCFESASGFGVKLSDRVIAALTCPEGRKDALFFDGDLPGFGLRITARGTRTFLFQYRAGTKVRRLRIGQWGREGEGLSAAQARKIASVHFGAVAGGGDPVGGQKAKLAATAAAEAETKLKRKVDAYTLAVLIQDWEAKHLATMRMSYRRDALGRIRLHLADLLETPAAAVTQMDVIKAVDRIAATAGETTARRTLGYARSAYSWAARRGTVAANPFANVPMPGRDVRRDRVLSAGEVGEIWQASAKLLYPYGPFVRFLLLTLQRREEVAGMAWGELAPDLSEWELPATRAKNGKAHLIHVAAAARTELIALGPDMPGELVFRSALPTNGPDGTLIRRGLTAFSYAKRRLDEEIAIARHKAAHQDGVGLPKTMPGWQLHDFRRTGVTRLADLGFAPHVCDRLLNHVTGSIQGVAAVYQRAEFLTERRAALEAWAGVVAEAGGL